VQSENYTLNVNGRLLAALFIIPTTKEKAMTVIAVIIMWGLFAIAIAVLNTGPADKEAKRRAEYWAKYERK
jgi:hypothetical protein